MVLATSGWNPKKMRVSCKFRNSGISTTSCWSELEDELEEYKDR